MKDLQTRRRRKLPPFFPYVPGDPNRAWAPQAGAWVLPHFRLHRLPAAINQVGLFMSRQTKLLSDLPLKDPAQA